MSKVDYCNAVLAGSGLLQRKLDRVQSVVNAAARLSADARTYDHVTPLLMDLHWLRVQQRIQYKLSVLMYRCLNGAAPRYLTESVGSTVRRRLLHHILIFYCLWATLSLRSASVDAKALWLTGYYFCAECN